MKILKTYLIPAFVIIFSLFVFGFFKIIPSSKLWKGYTVFYVQSDSDYRTVEEVLKNNSIDEFISLDNQLIPLNINSKTPEVALSISYNDELSNYLSERNSYFFDKSSFFRIYYIPEKYNSKIDNVCRILQKDYFYKAGINASSAYPLIVPVICMIFALILILYSERKLISALLFSLPVIFSFFVPLYSSAASICLLMYAIFFGVKVWGRNNAFFVLLKNPVFLSFCIFSFVMELFSGIKCTILYVILLCSIFSMFYFVSNLENLLEQKIYSFIPVKIRSASMINIVNKKSRFLLLPLSVCSLFVTLFAFFSINITFDTGDNLVLPSARAHEKSLPDLNDYINWRWICMSSPYISLNEKENQKNFGDTIYFSTYEEENGKIIEKIHPLSYDEKFKNDSISQIDNLNYPALEKMLKKQGKIKPGFSASGKQSLSTLSIVMLVISVIFPMIFYFFITKPKIKAGVK